MIEIFIRKVNLDKPNLNITQFEPLLQKMMEKF